MASSEDLPTFREKRDILFGDDTTDEKMRETGKLYMEAEQYDDALEFFARCEADDLVRNIAQLAVDQGDAALYLRSKVVLEEEADSDVLIDIAESAKEKNRASMARVAYQKAGNEEKAEELTEQILKGEEPKKAPEPVGSSSDSDPSS